MEDWQKSHITQNLPNLIRSTRFNVLVKAELLAQNILDEIDVDDLVTKNTHFLKHTFWK